jgi:hypothetical protein
VGDTTMDRVVADVAANPDSHTADVAGRLGLGMISALSWLQGAQEAGRVRSRPARAGLRWTVTGKELDGG